tara:strand:+ start:2661 stop:2855 length:195 start_codon:yes stop_codon:yes gene_type:complete
MRKRKKTANKKHVISYTKKAFNYKLFINYVPMLKDSDVLLNRRMYKHFENNFESNKAKVERKYQ